jgi:hypothetical protein
MMEDTPLPLDYPEQPNPPPRPTMRDDRVRRAAAEDILPDIIQWAGPGWREEEREKIINDLMAVDHLFDGYESARGLEDLGWSSCDAELVETLDGGWLWMAHRNAVKEWVAANGIRPRLSPGQAVIIPRYGAGAIVAINAEEATYAVQTEAWLKANPEQVGKAGGYAVNFEDAKAAS